MVRYRKLWILVLVSALVPLGLPTASANGTPEVGPIHADLVPPYTYYSVNATDADGDALTYTWSNTNPCGDFKGNGPRASWNHGEQTDCSHTTYYHEGTITVVVSDGTENGTVTRSYYEGSLQGDGSTPDSTTTCGATTARGAFEPSQAVWQDDDLFPDGAGHELRWTDPHHVTAELAMVQDKPTALFGVRGSRDSIYLAGLLDGTIQAPTLLRFTLHDASGTRVLFEKDGGNLPVEGYCQATKGFNVTVPAKLGVPATSFTLPKAGAYTITMELVEKDGGVVPGTQVVLDGLVTKVPPFHLQFVPLTLFAAYTAKDKANLSALPSVASQLAASSRTDFPDQYPLAPNSLTADASRRVTDGHPYAGRALKRCGDLAVKGKEPKDCVGQSILSSLNSAYAATSWLAHRGRVVLVLRTSDFNELGSFAKDAAAFTTGWKVIYAQPGYGVKTVAHEVAHSFPSVGGHVIWTGADMTAQCHRTFHNTGHFGNGVQLTLHSATLGTRVRHDGVTGLMGPATNGDSWMEQCTYVHLLQVLQHPRDPQVLGVRGWVARANGSEVGGLDPGLTLQSAADLTANTTGPYAIVERDATGATLATYRFDLPFATDTGAPLGVSAFAWRVPRAPGVAALEVTGPSGAIANATVASKAPTVSIQSPANGTTVSGDGNVSLAWKVEGAAGPATSWVQVSPDGGASWRDVALDTPNASVSIPGALLGNGTAILRVTSAAAFATSADQVTLHIASASSGGGNGGSGKGTPGPGALLAALAVAGAAALLRRRM